jgi:hypothetical protein
MQKPSPWPFLLAGLAFVVVAVLLTAYVWKTGGLILGLAGAVCAIIGRLINGR